jgi:hypothetical protein
VRITLRLFVALSLALRFSDGSLAQKLVSDLNKVYEDETHCLVAPEIRNAKDKPISCYCRDAVTDARYVYQTYILSQKDSNLNGTYLTLESETSEWCGKGYDVYQATRETGWRWNGPEVIRRYPTDSEIEQIKPNSFGARAVRYTVELVYRDSRGRRVSGESLTAVETFPPKGNKGNK